MTTFENVVRIYEKDGWFIIRLSEGMHGTQNQATKTKQGAIARAKRLWPSAKIKFGIARNQG